MDENYVPFGPEPVFVSDEPLSEISPSFGAYFEAAAGNVIRDSPLSSLYRMGELTAAQNAGGGGRTQSRTDARKISADDARAKAEEAGVSVDFGDGRYTPEAVDIMIDRQKRRAIRDATVAAYDPSWGTHVGVSLLTSMADPLNIGSAFIPFVGEARYAALLTRATSTFGRAGVRAGVGAVEGAAGAALVEPLIAGAATQEGRDYAMADSLYNVAFGAGFGGTLHTAGGLVKDKLFKRAEARQPVQTPADVVERLPVEVSEAALRGAVSDLVYGRPVQSAELIDSMLTANPKLKEAMSLASTLRRDGPALDDIEGRALYWLYHLDDAQRGEGAKPFVAWLREQGGLRDETGEFAAKYGNIGYVPDGTYIGPKASARTQRGVSLDYLMLAAEEQGYPATVDDIVKALKPDSGKTFTPEASKAQAARAATEEHLKALKKETGFRENMTTEEKAQTIARWESEMLAAENARVAASLDALKMRSADYQRIADVPKTTEVPEYVPEPAPKQAAEGEGKPTPPKAEAAEAATVPPARPAKTDAAPAPLLAMKAEELTALQGQIKAVEAEAQQRFAALSKLLPSEARRAVEEVLAKMDESQADLEKVYDAAVQCLLNPVI